MKQFPIVVGTKVDGDVPYGASAIRDHRKNTANFTVASNLPNNFGEKILYRLSTVCLPSVYLSTHTQVINWCQDI